jgi:uncharacterized protein YdeI (YjbR/CyaY-like superfamily)
MKTIYLKASSEWRSWLQKNGSAAKEIWLVYYKKESGKPRIAYEEAVNEALCFGWIDGMVKKLDDERFAQRFTPRKPSSRWSELNIERARKLIREKRMTEAGLAVFDPKRKTETRPAQLPAELEEKFKNHSQAWENFQMFPPYYRKMTATWVASAKKEETRLKRFEQLIEYSARKMQIKFM